MKPTSLLKKISVAGMLASCIFLVNCGRAKTDDTAAKIADKLALENSLPSCSDETMQLLRQRSTLFSSIRQILAGPIDDALKIRLQTYIDEVHTKSTSIKANVRKSKVAGFPATGCTFKEKETEIKYELSIIKTEDRTLAKRVSDANDKKPNQILANARPEWKTGDKLKLSNELAALLSNESFINGKRVIYNGKVANGGADFNLLRNKKDASVCFTSVVDGQEVTSGDVPEIGNISTRLDNKERIVRDVTLLVSALSGKRSLLITCLLADESDLNDALVDTFGRLLVKEEPAQ
jgi:hypothetical protein